jgi:thiamine-monophosphate kinase
LLASTYHTKIYHGIGDDAAVWQPSRSHRSVISSDVSVEGVHFRREHASAADIGYRALAVNLSDLAAMGARPVLATIALTIPLDVTTDWLLDAYRGMVELALRSRIALVGGDISRGAALSFGITVVGEVSSTRLTMRSGARVHDVIAVTGPLGRSRAGLALLKDTTLVQRVGNEALIKDALQAHRRPEPRLDYAKFLSASAHVHAMMDISDGLSVDLLRMMRASKCGAVVNFVPSALATQSIAHAAETDAHEWALHGGEDFELLITVERRAFRHVSMRFEKYFSKPLLCIGYCREEEGCVEDKTGIFEPLVQGGWDHLLRKT